MQNECKQCGNNLNGKQGGRTKFCNKSCHGKWLSINAKGENNPCWRGGPTPLICNHCGKSYFISAALYKMQGGKYCSQKCAARARIESGDFKREKNPLWKVGIERENNRIRKSKDYQDWRLQVWLRDGFRCQDCGEYGVKISAHHIRKFSTHPNLRFFVPNGITLCWPCHQKIRGTEDEHIERYASKINMLL